MTALWDRLARSEVLALATTPLAHVGAGWREDDAIRAVADQLARAGEGEGEGDRERELARLRTWTRPDHPRLHAVHESWVDAALHRFPARDRARASVWLREGGPHPTDDPWLATVHRACLATFDVGPTHLDPDASDPGDHLGWICLLDDAMLADCLDDLGRRVLAVTIATHDARQLLAALASLDERHRGGVRAYVSEYEHFPSEMRARTQELFLAVTRARGPSDRSPLIPTLALHMLATGSGGRFDLEVRYLAQRLPMALSTRLDRTLALSARRPVALALHARRLAAAALETIRSHAPEAP